MRNHGVIENDVDIEQVAEMAGRIGFSLPRMAWYTQHATIVDYKRYQAATRTPQPLPGNDHIRLRTFALSKKGAERIDSRNTKRLRGELAVSLLQIEGSHYFWRASYKNSGAAVWLNGESAIAGAVRIGYRQNANEGRVLIRNSEILPGESGVVEFSTKGDATGFDFVSEYVTWFANVGASTVKVVR